jgi:hypothetical protein
MALTVAERDLDIDRIVPDDRALRATVLFEVEQSVLGERIEVPAHFRYAAVGSGDSRTIRSAPAPVSMGSLKHSTSELSFSD